MKLYFKQRLFSWFDSYDIYDENHQTVYTVRGQLSWGHKLNVYDASGAPLGTLRERILTFLPKFEILFGDKCVGEIRKDFTFFKPHFTVDFEGWQVSGSFWEWDYAITDASGVTVATVSKELFRLTDTYVIDVVHEKDALSALMLVLAIDAEKCSRN